jgi:Family of unknown function (DUF695)
MQPDPARARFWQWFLDNGERLRAAMFSKVAQDREDATAELRDVTEPVAPGLIFEFGPAGEGEPRPVVVSADGQPERVDAVKEFVASAPPLPGWEVVAFRPGMEIGESIEIALEDQRVGAADLWFRVTEDEDGLNLALHVRGLTPENRKLRGLGATLLAQHAVGERTSLTLLNSLKVEPLPDDPPAAGLQPFGKLVAVFGEARERRYPPPGSLPVDLDEGWLQMAGTIGGADALILLHAGLRPVAGHPDYDRRLTVTIPFRAREDGMPATQEEYVAVADLGDRVSDALGTGQESLLAMTMTRQGRRELTFYTSAPEEALTRLEVLRAGEQTYPIEAEVDWDTYWGKYRSFCAAAEEGEGKE